MWCAALSHSMARFEGCRQLYKDARSGGVGAFTADNFPVFDYLKPNLIEKYPGKMSWDEVKAFAVATAKVPLSSMPVTIRFFFIRDLQTDQSQN